MTSLNIDIIASYLGKSWTAIIGILLVPLYIKFLGVESYGLVGFFASLTAVIGILDIGIGSTMTRELAKRSVNSNSKESQRDLVRTLEVIYWGIAVFAGVIILFGAPFISNSWIKSETLDVDTLFNAVRLMALTIVFRFPMSLYQGGLIGLQKQVLVSKIVVLFGTLRGIGVILILWLVSPTIEAFFLCQAIIGLFESFVFYILMWKSLPKSLNKASFKTDVIKEIWKYAAAISANAIIGVMLTQIDKVILSNMLTLKMFAYYTIASTVASSVWTIIIPFNTAIFPRLVILYESNQKEKLQSLFHHSSQLLSLLMLPVCATLIVFSKQILVVWINDPLVAENAHMIMSLLVFGTMLNGMVSLPVYSASAFGWPLLMMYTNIIQSILIIPLIVVLVNWQQGLGAAIGWIALNSTYIFIFVPLFFKRFLVNEKKKWFADTFIKLLAAFSISIISSLLAPKMATPFSSIVWIMVTGLLIVFVIAMTIPFLKLIIYEKWIVLFNKK